MAITFSIDNNRGTVAIDNLTLDQTTGVQSPPDGNDIDLSLTAGGDIDGFGPTAGTVDAGFETFLKNLGLTTTQKEFAAGGAGKPDVEGASSSSDFITLTATAGENITDLFFKVLDDPVTHNQIVGMQTLADEDLYLHVDASGNYATITTASGAGGRVVAAFALTSETIAADHHSATAGVQMVTFEAIQHTDTTDPDDTLNFTDVLQIGAAASLSFNFDQLKSGDFLWAAVGDANAAMLITGQDLNVNDKAGVHLGDIVKSGSTDPSDSVNTSQAAPGSEATIGINSQHFAPTNSGNGPTGVLTFVTGYAPLDSATPNYADINVNQIQYLDYINISGAAINISQLTGGSTSKIHLSLWEAGGQGADKAPADLIPEEGYSDVSGVSQSYIGNQDTDSHLTDDTAVAVDTVTIGANVWHYNDANITTGVTKGGITVTINGNNITVVGAQAGDTIGFTALDGASSVDGTFNRIDIQALQGSAAFDIGHIDLTQGATVGTGLGSHLFVDDDGPKIGNSDGVAADAIKEGLVDFVTNSSVSYSLNGATGTDPNASPYSMVDWTGKDTSIFVNGLEIKGIANSNTDPTQITYYADTDKSGTFGDGTDVAFFQLTLSQTDNSNAGSYTFTVLHDPPPHTNNFDFTLLPSGQNLFAFIADHPGDVNGQALLVFSEKADVNNPGDGKMTNTSGTINTSKGGGPITIGDSNQMYDNSGEGAVFVNAVDPKDTSIAGSGLTQKSADDSDNVKFANTYGATTGQIELVQIQGNQLAALKITASDIDETKFNTGGAGVNTDGESRDFVENPQTYANLVNVTAVRVFIGGQLVESWAYNTQTQQYEIVGGKDDATVDVQFDDTGHTGIFTATVTGLSIAGNQNTLIEYDTATNFEMTQVDYVGGAYDIGGFNTIQHLDTADLFFDFVAQAKDGDGDTALACWEVGVDGTGANDNNAVANIESGQPSDCTLPAALLAASTLSSATLSSSTASSSLGILGSGHTSDSMLSLSHMAHHDMFIA